MSFKNEENVKSMIVDAHKRGVCDSSGRSIKVKNSAGNRVSIAKPRFNLSSVVKTYVYRKGRMVLKNG